MQVEVPPQAAHLSNGMGLPAMAMPVPAIIVASQHQIGFKPRHQRTLKILSALQIAIGILCVVIYTVLIGLQRWSYNYRGSYLDYTGAGMWSGALYITAGSLGVAAVRQNRRGLIVPTMVMSILSSLFLWVVIGIAAQAIGSSVRSENCQRLYQTQYNSYLSSCFFYDFTGFKAADSILIVLSVAELITSIWCTVLCCNVSCKACCGSYYGNNFVYKPQAIYHAQAQSTGQQVIFAPQSGVAGGHVVAFTPAQPSCLRMQQQQPALFAHPAAPGAAVAPASYQPSVAGPPGNPANERGDTATGVAALHTTSRGYERLNV